MESNRCPVIHFDHNSSDHSADPPARTGRCGPRRRWPGPRRTGGTGARRLRVVFDAARDDDTFSSARSEHDGPGLSVVIPKTPHHDHIPIELDPPRFRVYRKIVNPVSAPAAVEQMKPTIDRHVAGFIDSVIETGTCDLTSVIGVPSIVTVEWLVSRRRVAALLQRALPGARRRPGLFRAHRGRRGRFPVPGDPDRGDDRGAPRRAASGRRSMRSRASPGCRRTLPSPAAAIRPSAMPTPLTKGSQPSKPISGCAAASCTRCSPAPKPISSQSGRRRRRAAASGARPGFSAGDTPGIRRRGSSSSMSRRWDGFSFLPCRRP